MHLQVDILLYILLLPGVSSLYMVWSFHGEQTNIGYCCISYR